MPAVFQGWNKWSNEEKTNLVLLREKHSQLTLGEFFKVSHPFRTRTASLVLLKWMRLVADSAETSEEESSWEGHSEDEEDGEVEVEEDAAAEIPTFKPDSGKGIDTQAPAKKRPSNALV
ncbi:hypothetical protein BJX65DRAFT_311068 [Aspergillus insuetus]